MKTIILLLLTCLPLCAATTYPMLSTTTNRTVTGGVTNMSLLNANQTFTGTNTFPAASFYPANGIYTRVLFSVTTNFVSGTLNTNTYAEITNAGGIINGLKYLDVMLPPLIGSNSTVSIAYTVFRTNAGAQNTVWAFYVGPNTNFLSFTSQFGASATYQQTLVGVNVFANYGSYTNQRVYANIASPVAYVPSNAAVGGSTNLVDTSVSWRFRMDIGATNVSAAALTNLVYQEFTILEYVKN